MSDADKSRNEGRRRLIKSAAVAPIVYTLPTGAALAATSLSCHTKGLDKFAPGGTAAVESGGVSYSSDGWVRARLQSYNFRVVGDPANPRSNGFTLDGTNYFKVSGATASAVSVVTTPAAQAPKVNAGQFYYVLIDYPSGNLILDSSAADVSPMAGASCWNSLAPGAEIPSDNIVIR